jgi:hypothetical protein
MMAFFLGYRTDSIREVQGLCKIRKAENTLQSLNPFAIH